MKLFLFVLLCLSLLLSQLCIVTANLMRIYLLPFKKLDDTEYDIQIQIERTVRVLRYLPLVKVVCFYNQNNDQVMGLRYQNTFIAVGNKVLCNMCSEILLI